MSDTTDTQTAPVPVTEDNIEVVVGGDHFYFRVPSPRDYARLGMRAAALRRQDSSGFGDDLGLDDFTASLYRSFAILETLLVKADVAWPYTETKTGVPVVDHTKFPPSKTPQLVEIARGFEDKFYTFLGSGT